MRIKYYLKCVNTFRSLSRIINHYWFSLITLANINDNKLHISKKSDISLKRHYRTFYRMFSVMYHSRWKPELSVMLFAQIICKRVKYLVGGDEHIIFWSNPSIVNSCVRSISSHASRMRIAFSPFTFTSDDACARSVVSKASKRAPLSIPLRGPRTVSNAPSVVLGGWCSFSADCVHLALNRSKAEHSHCTSCICSACFNLILSAWLDLSVNKRITI